MGRWSVQILTDISQFSKPVGVEAAAQRHAGAVQHDPQVAFGNAELGADFLAVHAVHFTQVEYGKDIFRQFVRAIMEGFPKYLAVQTRAGTRPFPRAELVNPAILEQAVRNKAVAFLIGVELESGEESLPAGCAYEVQNF